MPRGDTRPANPATGNDAAPASGARRQAVLLILLCVILAARPAAFSPAACAEDTAPFGRFDLAPYRVSVGLTRPADATVRPALRRSVASFLTARIGPPFGAAWSLQPAAAAASKDRELSPPNETGLARLSYAEVAGQLGAVACDKAFLLVVRPLGPRWIIAGREWDRTLQTLGPMLSSTTFDRRGIAEASLGLLKRLYSPLVIVDDADRDGRTAIVTIRAGSIPSGDPRLGALQKGEIH